MSEKNIIQSDNKSNDTSFEIIMEQAVPVISAWKQGELEGKRLELETDKYFFDKEFSIKKIVIISAISVILFVFILSTYLFVAGKDSIAKEILTVTLTSIMRIPVKPATHSGFSLPPDGIFHFLNSALFKWQVSSRIFYFFLSHGGPLNVNFV